MHLIGVKFRVKQYPKGWVVEYLKKTNWILWDQYTWTHAIAYSGMDNEPFYYSSKERAIEEAQKHLKWDLIAYGTGGFKENYKP